MTIDLNDQPPSLPTHPICLLALFQTLHPLLLVVLQEIALLKAIEEAVIAMLARCFEEFYAVSEDAATGILDGNVAATESPAPVLHHAVLLAGASFLLQ